MIKKNKWNSLINIIFRYLLFTKIKKKIIFINNLIKIKRKLIKIIFYIVFLIIYISPLLCKLFFINFKNIKICVCTSGKKENLYAREFVEHYKLYGVDKIFIYDNNEINGEVFDNVLSDYISNKFVEIINYRGKIQAQLQMLNNCYKNIYEKYDWFILFDMDEFIHLKSHINIKSYLKRSKFRKYEVIYLFRAFHTDNNHLHYYNKSLFERFPKSIYDIITVKPILRGHIPNLKIKSCHIINEKIKSCYSHGEKQIKKMDFKNYFIDHFYFKSTEEFIEKINRGDIFYKNINKIKMAKIKYYFKSNNITLSKINYIEKEAKINLTKFRQKLIKNINLST